MATKHAILGLDEALRQELMMEGLPAVQVVTIEPWAADTPIWDHAANYTRHEPRAPSLDDPDKVVSAILSAALRLKARVAVGWEAQATVLSEGLAPDLTEHAAAALYHRVQIQRAPAGAPPSSGPLQVSPPWRRDGGRRAARPLARRRPPSFFARRSRCAELTGAHPCASTT